MAKGKKNNKPHTVPKIPTGAEMLKAVQKQRELGKESK